MRSHLTAPWLSSSSSSSLTAPPPPPVEVMPSPSPGWDSKISPSVLLLIAILSIIFFLSGLLHLLIRYLLTPPRPSTPTFLHHDPSSFDGTALQGQLHQLFHLHDAGVDQSFIDALPVFLYRSITGAHKKDPFDCAVCLCEFDPEDKLRLLPKCSHAFHLHCIDTWLLSHSTCPLCRRSLLPPSSDCDSPAVVSRVASLENDPFYLDPPEPTSSKDQPEAPPPPSPPQEEKVIAIKLGKYRTTTVGEGSSSATIDNRRCFSMGSLEYVMDESSLLQVAIKPPEEKKKKNKKNKNKQRAGRGRRMAMSEWDCESQRETKVGKESMPISKTLLRGCGKEEEAVVEGGSRRVVSFRLPGKTEMGVDEADVGSEIGCDVESCCETTTTSSWNGAEVVRRGEETRSFARRTMLWVMGRNHLVSTTSSRVGDHMG